MHECTSVFSGLENNGGKTFPNDVLLSPLVIASTYYLIT